MKMELQRQASDTEPEAVELLRRLTAGWTVDYLAEMVKRGDSISQESIRLLLDHLGRHLTLITVREEDFLAAADAVRPDLAPVLRTEKGRAWIQRISARLVEALPLYLFGRGRQPP